MWFVAQHQWCGGCVCLNVPGFPHAVPSPKSGRGPKPLALHRADVPSHYSSCPAQGSSGRGRAILRYKNKILLLSKPTLSSRFGGRKLWRPKEGRVSATSPQLCPSPFITWRLAAPPGVLLILDHGRISQEEGRFQKSPCVQDSNNTYTHIHVCRAWLYKVLHTHNHIQSSQ